MKTYGIIGLGHFGYHVARGLAEQGLDVIAVDEDEDKVNSVSHIIENALVLDSTDKKALQEAGLVELDVVVVSMGRNVESSILTVMALKDLKNRVIIAKALNSTHGEVLSKIGAHKVIYPEKEAAKRVVKNISARVVFEVVDISNTLKGVKFEASELFEGKKPSELNQMLEGIKLIAFKSGANWSDDIDESYRVKKYDILFCIGQKNEVERVYERFLR